MFILDIHTSNNIHPLLKMLSHLEVRPRLVMSYDLYPPPSIRLNLVLKIVHSCHKYFLLQNYERFISSENHRSHTQPARETIKTRGPDWHVGISQVQCVITVTCTFQMLTNSFSLIIAECLGSVIRPSLCQQCFHCPVESDFLYVCFQSRLSLLLFVKYQ